MDFWAQLPSATMVITAATPITMPSAVSTERSLFARMACSATMTVSPKSMLPPDLHPGPRPGAASHAGDGVTAHPRLHLLALLLRLHQAGARQDEHGVGVAQPAHHLRVVEIGEPGADRH